MSQSAHAVLYDAYTRRWLCFRRPVTVLAAHDLADVQPLLESVQTQVERQGLSAAGFVSYEAAPAFDTALQVNPCENFPLAWFGLYAEVEAIALPLIASLPPLPHLDWRASITQAQYKQAIDQIKSYIQQGETYQVNFSFRLTAPFEEPWSYFVRMIHAQQGLYGGFIDTDNWTICSSSPELFFQQIGSELICRPMKGTAARGLTYSDDLRSANWLQASPKNRAENLMIVDMVRNDLARVAKLGSVQVPQLFAIEQYPTLWQMISSVRCETEARVPELFQALFPPASITGAPKPRTMQIIAELERTPRRIYTGTIGFIMPQRSQFNVAIRTALIDKIEQKAEYSVGSGVVWDSQAENEFEECYTKTKVLTEPLIDFSLLETLLWTPDTGYFLLNLHLIRLQESAAYFAIPIDLELVDGELQAIAQTFPPHAQKVRILLSRQGEMTTQAAAYDSVPPFRVQLAKTPVDSSDIFLYHKTTYRQVYARAKQACPDADDVLLWNERGELTESCIANLVVEIEGNWYTPPVHCGLLAGTFRRWLLEQGKVQEKVIAVEDLSRCSRIFLVNSVYKQQVVCCF